MSEQRTVSKNITQTFIVQIPNYVLGVIAGIFLTRHLGPEGKGVYTLLLTNVQLFVMFLGLNLPGSIQYFMANKKIDPAGLKGMSLLLLLIGAVIVFVTLFLIPGGGEAFLTKDYDTFYFRCYIFISFIITNLNALLTGFLQGNHQFKSVNRLSVINGTLNFILFTSLYYASHYNLIDADLGHVLILTVFVLLVNTAVLLIAFRKFVKVEWGFHFSSENLAPLLKFLIPAYISVLVNFFNYRLTILMVNYFEGAESLGYFSLALNLAQMMLMVTLAINTVLFPHFASKADWESALKDFRFALKVNIALMFAATVTLVLLAGFLIPIFYGEIFIPSVNAVKILAVGTFFSSQTQVFGHFLGARNMNWVNTIVYGVALLVLSVMGLLLIPIYGIEGASLASGVSYFVMFTIFCIFVKVKFKVELLSLFILSKTDIQRAKGIAARITKRN